MRLGDEERNEGRRGWKGVGMAETGGEGKGRRRKEREGKNTVSATHMVSPRSFSSAATSWVISRSSGGGKADDILFCMLMCVR